MIKKALIPIQGFSCKYAIGISDSANGTISAISILNNLKRQHPNDM